MRRRGDSPPFLLCVRGETLVSLEQAFTRFASTQTCSWSTIEGAVTCEAQPYTPTAGNVTVTPGDAAAEAVLYALAKTPSGEGTTIEEFVAAMDEYTTCRYGDEARARFEAIFSDHGVNVPSGVDFLCEANCGDGVVDSATWAGCDDIDGASNPLICGGEQCDDGNNVDGDGCTNSCTTPVCGDGVVQTQLGEECDGRSYTITSCSQALGTPTAGYLTCDANCQISTQFCTSCGNGIVDAGLGEVCEANADNTHLCAGLDTGLVGNPTCDEGCMGFDESTCCGVEDPPENQPNEPIVQPGCPCHPQFNPCDEGYACSEVGYCVKEVVIVPPSCGNGTIDAFGDTPENCDGVEVPEDWVCPPGEAGKVKCSDDCQTPDMSGCFVPTFDDVLEAFTASGPGGLIPGETGGGCAGSSCHSSDKPESLNLTLLGSPGIVGPEILGPTEGTSGACTPDSSDSSDPLRWRIVPGDPEGGSLPCRLKSTNVAVSMPYYGVHWSDGGLEMLELWIAAGAPGAE